MCGIAGLLHFEPGHEVDQRILDRMTDVLRHRGPDGRGTHVDRNLGLGHRRLAIIDLSPDAAQPLGNEDESVWVVFNGEIYNFRDLREELLGRGHRFRSRTDSEVLVHLYEEVGDALVDRLRGMFAFALWDARRRRLLLARDRFGQKPLYYRLTADSLHFASEIKGILEDPAVPREPDLQALDAYLTYGYVPAPATAFAGVRKLPPAHLLSIETDGSSRFRRYWRLEFQPKSPVELSRGARRRVAGRVLELLDEATRLRMISDVPLGAFLSGGLDSSAVVASMCAAAGGDPRSVKTFSIGFREASFDETGHAAEVARHLGTEHRRLELTRDAFAELERIGWHYGEPFADSSCLPTFALSGLARRHVTVALTGDGGDEIFCGYRRYSGTQLATQLQGAFPLLRAAATSPLATGLLRACRRGELARELELLGRSRGLAASDLFLARIEAIDSRRKAQLCEAGFRRRDREAGDRVRRLIDSSAGETLAERCADTDSMTYLPDDILVKVDVASMAHGLECRAPLLDHLLAEFIARLPFRLKMSGLQTKLALRTAVAGRLPPRTLRRSKKGFSIPLDSWLRSGPESMLRDILLSARAVERGYFRRAGVEQLIDEHVAEPGTHQTALFTLLMLEIWHRLWIDPPQGGVLERPDQELVRA